MLRATLARKAVSNAYLLEDGKIKKPSSSLARIYAAPYEAEKAGYLLPS